MSELDHEELAKWANKDLTNLQAGVTFSQQDEQATEIKIQEILEDFKRRGFPSDRRKVVAGLRALERLGVAKVVAGRHGNTGTRIVSPLGIQAVGRAALEAVSSDSNAATCLHRFRLRPDFEVTFRLPEDVTVVEAKRLARHIELLPFDQGSA